MWRICIKMLGIEHKSYQVLKIELTLPFISLQILIGNHSYLKSFSLCLTLPLLLLLSVCHYWKSAQTLFILSDFQHLMVQWYPASDNQSLLPPNALTSLVRQSWHSRLSSTAFSKAQYYFVKVIGYVRRLLMHLFNSSLYFCFLSMFHLLQEYRKKSQVLAQNSETNEFRRCPFPFTLSNTKRRFCGLGSQARASWHETVLENHSVVKFLLQHLFKLWSKWDTLVSISVHSNNLMFFNFQTWLFQTFHTTATTAPRARATNQWWCS